MNWGIQRVMSTIYDEKTFLQGIASLLRKLLHSVTALEKLILTNEEVKISPAFPFL